MLTSSFMAVSRLNPIHTSKMCYRFWLNENHRQRTENWISKRSLTCIFQSAKFEADKLQCRQLLWRKEFWTALKTCLRVGVNGFLVGTVLITYFSLASIEIDKHIAGVENGSSFNKPVEARCIWYSRQYSTKAKCKNLTLTHFTEIPINFRTNSVKNRLQNIFCTKS